MRTAAGILSLVFNPMSAASLFLIGLILAHGPAWIAPSAEMWGLLVGVPFLLLLWGLKRGCWSDLDMTDRNERRTFMPWTLLMAGISTVVVFTASFPRALRLADLGIFLWLLISVVVGIVWKISLHVGGITGILWLLFFLAGPGTALLVAWIPPAVAWSRLYLKKHDLPQVLGGAAAGTLAVFASAFLLHVFL